MFVCPKWLIISSIYWALILCQGLHEEFCIHLYNSLSHGDLKDILLSLLHRGSNWDSEVEILLLWLPRERNKAGRSIAPVSQAPVLQALLNAKSWSETEEWTIILWFPVTISEIFQRPNDRNYWIWQWQTAVPSVLMWCLRLSILILISEIWLQDSVQWKNAALELLIQTMSWSVAKSLALVLG